MYGDGDDVCGRELHPPRIYGEGRPLRRWVRKERAHGGTLGRRALYFRAMKAKKCNYQREGY